MRGFEYEFASVCVTVGGPRDASAGFGGFV